MKKRLALALVAAIAFGLTACSVNPDDGISRRDEKPEHSTEEKKDKDNSREDTSDKKDSEEIAGETPVWETEEIIVTETQEPVFTAPHIIEVDEVVMPNLVGMTWDEACAQYGNNLNLVAQQEWSTVTKDEIFYQEFAEGRKVKKGATVTVKVSSGIKEIEIQDLTDKTANAAECQLLKDGFKVSKTYAEDDTVTKDYVIRTIPAAHETAPQGSTVVIVISMGPEDTVMYMPRLVDMPVEDALKRCEEYQLVPEIKIIDSAAEKGLVLEQSIELDTPVERNTMVVLKVSSGELAELTKTFKVTLPKKAEGEFVFEYYIDGILDEDATETRDIGAASEKVLSITVNGAVGETKRVTINATSTRTGLSDTYFVADVTFDGEKNPAEVVSTNSEVFEKLLSGIAVE